MTNLTFLIPEVQQKDLPRIPDLREASRVAELASVAAEFDKPSHGCRRTSGITCAGAKELCPS